MKIVCLTPWFPSHRNDQPGNYILDALQALRALGVQQKIIWIQAWKPSYTKKIAFTDDFSITKACYFSIPRHYGRLLSNYCLSKKIEFLLEQEIRQNRPDVIHAHTELYAVAAVKVGMKFGIPTVVTIHGLETSRRYWYSTKKAIGNALSLANRVVLVGEPLRDFFRDLVSADNHFSVVYNGFRFSPAFNQERDKLWPAQVRIISVSNLHEGKGIDLNLYALAKLTQEGFDEWHYTIVGGGREKKALIALVKSLNLITKVSFAGACNHDQVYRYLMDSDVFSLPSYREAFGIAYIEAMAAGLLTIGVEGQGPAAFIKHGKTGLFVLSRDVNSLTNAFKNVLTNRQIMHEMAKAGKAHIINNFTWQSHAEAMRIIYQQL